MSYSRVEVPITPSTSTSMVSEGVAESDRGADPEPVLGVKEQIELIVQDPEGLHDVGGVGLHAVIGARRELAEGASLVDPGVHGCTEDRHRVGQAVALVHRGGPEALDVAGLVGSVADQDHMGACKGVAPHEGARVIEHEHVRRVQIGGATVVQRQVREIGLDGARVRGLGAVEQGARRGRGPDHEQRHLVGHARVGRGLHQRVGDVGGGLHDHRNLACGVDRARQIDTENREGREVEAVALVGQGSLVEHVERLAGLVVHDPDVALVDARHSVVRVALHHLECQRQARRRALHQVLLEDRDALGGGLKPARGELLGAQGDSVHLGGGRPQVAVTCRQKDEPRYDDQKAIHSNIPRKFGRDQCKRSLHVNQYRQTQFARV